MKFCTISGVRSISFTIFKLWFITLSTKSQLHTGLSPTHHCPWYLLGKMWQYGEMTSSSGNWYCIWKISHSLYLVTKPRTVVPHFYLNSHTNAPLTFPRMKRKKWLEKNLNTLHQFLSSLSNRFIFNISFSSIFSIKKTFSL